jgi:hypothetical protein
MKVKKIFHLFGKILGPVKGMRVFLLFAACFLLSLAPGAFAQESQKSNLSDVLKQDSIEKHTSTVDMTRQTGIFLEGLDPLNLRTSNERPDEGTKIRTVLLYPQSFSPARSLALQTTPARSYFLSFNDQGKESAYVGLANIESEEKTEVKGIYQKDMNAELLLGYQWVGFGSILFGRAFQYERFGDDVGRVNDMGWRIKFVKTF